MVHACTEGASSIFVAQIVASCYTLPWEAAIEESIFIRAIRWMASSTKEMFYCRRRVFGKLGAQYHNTVVR
jgi:hypothetical protein